METDVYERLARHFDGLPAGFPPTESGVELRILRRLFSPEDAHLALHLTLIPETPKVVARRAGMPVEETARRLESMEERGLIYGEHREGHTPRYQALQFVVGFWEGQVNRLSPELVHDFEEYLPDAFDAELWRKAPQLRTVPVGESISLQTEVMPYERVEELVQAHDTFSVSNCICRQEMHTIGEGCDKPLESCLGFGSAAGQITRSGRGRAISREESLGILHRAEEAGLVVQPANARDALFICTCCGCCCGVLRSVKRYPKPASLVSSAFAAVLDSGSCSGCGICETRCQMEAISVPDGVAVLDKDRCIGCGLCVTKCPTGSLSLVRKPQEEQPYVPRDIVDNYIKIGRARGKMGNADLVGMLVKSKLDRLLALR